VIHKIRSLELLRAFAALLVVLFHTETIFLASGHTPFRGVFSAGNRGVDLFFVLSGFIIAYVHRGDLGRPGRLGNYIYSRLTRIYPAALIMTAFALAVYAIGFGGAGKGAKLDPQAVAASFLLLAQHGAPLVNVTWTLTYEMFFYAVFAVLIVNLRAGLALLLLWQGAAAVLAVTGVNLGLSGYYLRSICLEFSLGLACAWWLIRNPVPRHIWTAWLWLALGTLSFVAGMALNNAISWAPALCALGAAMLILAFVRLEQSGRIRVPGFLVRFGGASYAVYIVHYSVITMLGAIIMHKLHLQVTDWLCLGCAAAGIACGLVFDYAVDRPIQRFFKALKQARRSGMPVGARAGGRGDGVTAETTPQAGGF
jgi:exopolysaccharide production protein ExoZ